VRRLTPDLLAIVTERAAAQWPWARAPGTLRIGWLIGSDGVDGPFCLARRTDAWQIVGWMPDTATAFLLTGTIEPRDIAPDARTAWRIRLARLDQAAALIQRARETACATLAALDDGFVR
jgi:hypothetical protein